MPTDTALLRQAVQLDTGIAAEQLYGDAPWPAGTDDGAPA